MTGSASRSLRVEAIWPNFTNMPPTSSRVRRSRRPNSAVVMPDAVRNCGRASPFRRAVRSTSHDRPNGAVVRRSQRSGWSHRRFDRRLPPVLVRPTASGMISSTMVASTPNRAVRA